MNWFNGDGTPEQDQGGPVAETARDDLDKAMPSNGRSQLLTGAWQPSSPRDVAATFYKADPTEGQAGAEDDMSFGAQMQRLARASRVEDGHLVTDQAQIQKAVPFEELEPMIKSVDGAYPLEEERVESTPPEDGLSKAMENPKVRLHLLYAQKYAGLPASLLHTKVAALYHSGNPEKAEQYKDLHKAELHPENGGEECLEKAGAECDPADKQVEAAQKLHDYQPPLHAMDQVDDTLEQLRRVYAEDAAQKSDLGPDDLEKGDLTPEKARQILHDKEVRGHPLTDKQRRFMGAIGGHLPAPKDKKVKKAEGGLPAPGAKKMPLPPKDEEQKREEKEAMKSLDSVDDLIKSSGQLWADKLIGSPFYVDALRLEKQYMQACDGVDDARKKARKSDVEKRKARAAAAKEDKTWDQIYAAESKARDTYDQGKRDLVSKYMDWRIKQEERYAAMGKSLDEFLSDAEESLQKSDDPEAILEDLIKGGEGSKGGHVIGHTASGNNVKKSEAYADELAKADKIDYWRTINHQKVGFSGAPGKGEQVTGHPNLTGKKGEGEGKSGGASSSSSGGKPSWKKTGNGYSMEHNGQTATMEKKGKEWHVSVGGKHVQTLTGKQASFDHAEGVLQEKGFFGGKAEEKPKGPPKTPKLSGYNAGNLDPGSTDSGKKIHPPSKALASAFGGITAEKQGYGGAAGSSAKTAKLLGTHMKKHKDFSPEDHHQAALWHEAAATEVMKTPTKSSFATKWHSGRRKDRADIHKRIAMAHRAAMETKKSLRDEENIMAGLEAMDDFLEKAEGQGGFPASGVRQSMPGGDSGAKQQAEDGGVVAGAGMTSGAQSPPGGETVAATVGGKGDVKKDKLSDDDAVDEGQMKPHKKPIEKTAKSFAEMLEDAPDGGERARAQILSIMRKGDEDVLVGFGVAPPDRLEKAEDEELCKSCGKMHKAGECPMSKSGAEHWVQKGGGQVLYSDTADRAVDHYLEKGGHYQPSNVHMQGQLHKSIECPHCENLTKAMFSDCEACGMPIQGGAHNAHPAAGQMVMEKSIVQSLVPPDDDDILID